MFLWPYDDELIDIWQGRVCPECHYEAGSEWCECEPQPGPVEADLTECPWCKRVMALSWYENKHGGECLYDEPVWAGKLEG